MVIAFISKITETTTNAQLLSEIAIDFAFYTILSGVIGWILFRKERRKIIHKAVFSLMILLPGLFLLFQL